MDKNSCIFCFIPHEEILEETENFYIKTEKFPIVRGTILIIPKKHLACYGQMPNNLDNELSLIKVKIKTFYKAAYPEAKQIFMEHGIEGQTIFHAHLHCMPSSLFLFENFNKDLKEFRKIHDTNELRVLYKQWKSYFFYEEKDTQFLFRVKNLRPGYLRYILAVTVGAPEKANWRKLPENIFQKDVTDLIKAWIHFNFK